MRFKQFTTRRAWRYGNEGPLWQSQFHDHIVWRREGGMAVAVYMRNNPVNVGFVLGQPDI